MPTQKLNLKLISSGYCGHCDTKIGSPTWCVVEGSTKIELRHLVEENKITKNEANAQIAQEIASGKAELAEAPTTL